MLGNITVINSPQSSSQTLAFEQDSYHLLIDKKQCLNKYYNGNDIDIQVNYVSMKKIDNVCWKSIESEAVFTKIEIKNKWNLYFLQNNALGIQHTKS